MQDMRHIKLVAIVVLGLLGLAFAVIFLSPSLPRPGTLSLRVLRSQKAGTERAELSVIISNASDSIVMYDHGPPLDVAYLENNSWRTNYSNRSVTGAMFLYPRRVATPIDITQSVPRSTDVKAVRVGLSFVSLSWRSKLGLAVSKVPLLQPLSGLLFRLDGSKRSLIEWSDPAETF